MRGVRELANRASNQAPKEHSRQHETDATVVAISNKKYVRITLTLTNGEEITTSAARFDPAIQLAEIGERAKAWPPVT